MYWIKEQTHTNNPIQLNLKFRGSAEPVSRLSWSILRLAVLTEVSSGHTQYVQVNVRNYLKWAKTGSLYIYIQITLYLSPLTLHTAVVSTVRPLLGWSRNGQQGNTYAKNINSDGSTRCIEIQWWVQLSNCQDSRYSKGDPAHRTALLAVVQMDEKGPVSFTAVFLKLREKGCWCVCACALSSLPNCLFTRA